MPEDMSPEENAVGCWVFPISVVIGFLANPMVVLLVNHWWPYALLILWVPGVLIYARLTNRWWPLPKPIDRVLRKSRMTRTFPKRNQ